MITCGYTPAAPERRVHARAALGGEIDAVVDGVRAGVGILRLTESPGETRAGKRRESWGIEADVVTPGAHRAHLPMATADW